MALSIKVALLTSLGFIFGMSWLVSQVARPIVELPTPLVVRGPAGGGEGRAALAADVEPRREGRRSGAAVAGRFERSSVLEAAARRDEPEDVALVVAEPLPPVGELTEPELPPLYVPEAPVVALVEERLEEPPISIGAGSSVMTMTSVPEAIVADVPSAGARLLAALRPGPVADVVADPEPRAPAPRQYTVKPGDSLAEIMRREWDRNDEESLKMLLAANPELAKRRDLIYAGEVLNIPDLNLAPDGPSREVPEFRWYTIRKRDSLVGIARRHLNDPGRWREIAELNRLRNAHKILPGMRIKLPLIRADV